LRATVARLRATPDRFQSLYTHIVALTRGAPAANIRRPSGPPKPPIRPYTMMPSS